MEIRLLGPELEHVQSNARRELDETIERRKKEVENEVLNSLSEIASDGKRVLKSQKPTYEMMLQLDGLVKENEDLFLRVNALCEKTGVSLNAIIERMVSKNKELREKAPVEAPVHVENTPSLMPSAEEIDKKKADVVMPDFTAETELSGGEVDREESFEVPSITIDYDPDDIKFDWQRASYGKEDSSVDQDLPSETFTATTSEYVSEPIAVESEPVSEEVRNTSYSKVRGRRLYNWGNGRSKEDCLVRAVICDGPENGDSTDYSDLSKNILELVTNYRSLTPEEDNVSLDALDQSIGASSTLTVSEKRKLYRKLNFCAKMIERYARATQMAR